jgi:hypothetical protein
VLKVAPAVLALAALFSSCTQDSGQTEAQNQSTLGASTTPTEETATTSSESMTRATVETDELVARVQTPSGNIHCDAWMYGPKETDAQMRCFIEEISGPELPRPAWAHCDWDGGRSFELGGKAPGARASFCDALGAPLGDVVTLEYGSAWTHGPFTCLSSQLGLLCTNASGHGVFLSRERQEPF